MDGEGLATKPTITEIQRVVCEAKRLTLADMKSPTRQQRVAYPRQVAMALVRELNGASYPLMGRLFGNRDHTTCLFAVRKIAREAARNPALSERMAAYRTRIAEVVAARPVADPAPEVVEPEPEPVAEVWNFSEARWTMEDLAILRAAWRLGWSAKKISTVLKNRTPTAIKSKAYSLGLALKNKVEAALDELGEVAGFAP